MKQDRTVTLSRSRNGKIELRAFITLGHDNTALAYLEQFGPEGQLIGSWSRTIEHQAKLDNQSTQSTKLRDSQTSAEIKVLHDINTVIRSYNIKDAKTARDRIMHYLCTRVNTKDYAQPKKNTNEKISSL